MDDFPEHRGIKIKGQRLACLVAGEPSAPPILMVHGWAHYPDVWTSTMAALRADYYCVAVGCGEGVALGVAGIGSAWAAGCAHAVNSRMRRMAIYLVGAIHLAIVVGAMHLCEMQHCLDASQIG